MSAAETIIEVDSAEPRSTVRLTTAQLAPRLVSRSSRTAHVALVAAGALLLPGDQVSLRIRVGAGCLLHLEDIGGTVAYGPGAQRARWTTDIELAPGAALVWAAKPLIVSDGADVRRTTRVRLADGAILLARETTVLGRSGENGGTIRSRTLIDQESSPLLAEGLTASGSSAQPGILGGHRVFDTVTVAGLRPDAQSPGTMMLEGEGAVARHLGPRAHDTPLGVLWDAWLGQIIAERSARREQTHDYADR